MSNTERPLIRVTKEFCFEMAHLLTEYDGLCRNIHGHSYKLAVTVRTSSIRSLLPMVCRSLEEPNWMFSWP